MGEMRRAIAREEQERQKQDRFASTLVIAASIIAAVRLAHFCLERKRVYCSYSFSLQKNDFCE
jgi:hypothetical protein